MARFTLDRMVKLSLHFTVCCSVSVHHAVNIIVQGLKTWLAIYFQDQILPSSCTVFYTLYYELYYTLNLTLYLTLYCSLCSTLFCTLGCLRYFFVRNITLLSNVQNAMYRQDYLVKKLFIGSTLCFSLSKCIITTIKHSNIVVIIILLPLLKGFQAYHVLILGQLENCTNVVL